MQLIVKYLMTIFCCHYNSNIKMKLLAILIGLVAFNETAPLYIHIYMASNTRIVVMISLDQNKF